MPAKISEAKPAEKLLHLFTLLIQQGSRQISLKELAAALECSKQTVLRLIDQMDAARFGRVQSFKRGREVCYAMRTPPHMQINISGEGLRQLALCRNLLRHMLPEKARRLLDGTLRDAAAHAEEGTPPEAVTIGQTYVKGHIDNTLHEEKLETFSRAIESRRVCIVTYRRSLIAQPRTFSFAPMRLIAYLGTFRLLGWEVSDKGRIERVRDHAMTLLLHRCCDVRATPRSSQRLPVPDGAQPIEGLGPFGTMAGPVFPVRVHFAPEAATYVHERQWSVREEKRVHEDGSLTLDFDAQSEEEVVSWVLGFGGQATVLSPASLRDEVRRQGEAIVRNSAGDAAGT
jgi:predicted DNA-binding transcriptional regulator YafY